MEAIAGVSVDEEGDVFLVEQFLNRRCGVSQAVPKDLP